MLERDFQRSIIREISRLFPGCIVLKNDASYKQGVPDLIILYDDRWATLECKTFKSAHRQPNQTYWVDLMNKMSFSAVIYPENRREVLDDLEDFMKERRI